MKLLPSPTGAFDAVAVLPFTLIAAHAFSAVGHDELFVFTAYSTDTSPLPSVSEAVTSTATTALP